MEYAIIPKRQRLTEDMNRSDNLTNNISFHFNRFSYIRIYTYRIFFKKFSHLFFETVDTLSGISLNYWSADHVSQRSPTGVTCTFLDLLAVVKMFGSVGR